MTIVAMCPYCRAGWGPRTGAGDRGERPPARSAGATSPPSCRVRACPGGAEGTRCPPDSVTETRSLTRQTRTSAEPSPVISHEPREVVRRIEPPPAPPSPPSELALAADRRHVVRPGGAGDATRSAGRSGWRRSSLVGGPAEVLSRRHRGSRSPGRATHRRAHYTASVFYGCHPRTTFLGLDVVAAAGNAHRRLRVCGRPRGTGESDRRTWVDASTASWRLRPTCGWRSDPLPSGRSNQAGRMGAKRTPKDPVLEVTIRISNRGIEQRVDLTEWAVGGGGGETQRRRRGLSQTEAIRVGVEDFRSRNPAQHTVYPGRSVEVTLSFEPPAHPGPWLKLELSGGGGGRDRRVRPAPVRSSRVVRQDPRRNAKLNRP